MRAINLSSKLRPSAYRSVTEMVFTSIQKVIKPFCFAPFIFLTLRRMSCLRQKVNDRGKIRLSSTLCLKHDIRLHVKKINYAKQNGLITFGLM